MYTKLYWIHKSDNGARLAIMARPRGGEWLEDEIIQFRKQNIGVIVSLLEPPEITELGLKDEEQLCKKHGIVYINFPIPDRNIPGSNDKARALVSGLRTKLDEGISITIHCRMGIGRSSIIAAAVLLQGSGKADAIIQHISKIRGVSVPDTNEQVKWLHGIK